jgi:putative hemolysin
MQAITSTGPIVGTVDVSAHYTVRLAQNQTDVVAAQALRFTVFNLELGEGFETSKTSLLDQDRFDSVCDHLLVEHGPTRTVVGTYRLQPGFRARAQLGFYSMGEFDLAPLERLTDESIELGRACVDRAHRNLSVITLLWRGIALYAQRHHARYLFGCSSLTSQDPAVGASVYTELCRRHLVAPPLRIQPQAGFECPLDRLCAEAPPIPKLLRAYLGLGAKICGPPALDREFRTIDFLTWLDLEQLAPATRSRFLPTELEHSSTQSWTHPLNS